MSFPHLAKHIFFGLDAGNLGLPVMVAMVLMLLLIAFSC
jgi:hypothetical protein